MDLYRNTRCPNCGRLHDLLDVSPICHQPGGTYSYTCPATGQAVTVRWLRVPEAVLFQLAADTPMEWVAG